MEESVQRWGSEREVVPASCRLHLTSPRLDVIVLNEAIVILIFTHLWAVPTPCSGQRAMPVAGMVSAAEVALGSERDEYGEDHRSQHNPYKHRPCPAPSAQTRGRC